MKIKVSSLTIASVLIIILFPIGGLLIVLLLLSKVSLYRKKDFNVDTEDDIDKVDFYFLPDIDIQKESNIIALEDVLEISGLNYRRKTVLDILKRDVDEYTDFLYSAIKNEDPETTHYAAASILDTKRNLDFRLGEAKKAYIENDSDYEILINYGDLLLKKLKTPDLDEQMKKSYTMESVRILKKIVDNKISMEEKYIIALIEILLDIEEFNTVNYYCKLFMQNYHYTEKKYITLLRSFYLMEDKINFKKVLLRLKQDNIPLSKEGTRIVEFWLGGKP